MNMPSKGTPVTVDGYGRGLFVGASNLQSDDASVMLKFEGSWRGENLNDGYGAGIISIPLDEYQENRVHREQGETCDSTEKRDEIFEQRFGASED